MQSSNCAKRKFIYYAKPANSKELDSICSVGSLNERLKSF
jgi:hypothetical protein